MATFLKTHPCEVAVRLLLRHAPEEHPRAPAPRQQRLRLRRRPLREAVEEPPRAPRLQADEVLRRSKPRALVRSSSAAPFTA